MKKLTLVVGPLTSKQWPDSRFSYLLNVKSRFLISLVLIIISACSTKERREIRTKNSPPFKVEFRTIADTTQIAAAVPFHGNYMCLLENGHLRLFDSNFNYLKETDVKLPKGNYSFLNRYHDTTWLGTWYETYILDSNFSCVSKNESYRKDLRFIWDGLLLENGDYQVFACCMGEFGGSVFFVNKHNDTTYSCPAGCATQVLREDSGYLVNGGLYYGSDFFIVKDPKKMRAQKTNLRVVYCNDWHIHDSLSADSAMHNTTAIGTIPHVTTLFTSRIDNEIFSVLYHYDSTLIVIVKHVGSQIVPLQVVRVPHEFETGMENMKSYEFGKHTLSFCSHCGITGDTTFRWFTAATIDRKNIVFYQQYSMTTKTPGSDN